MTYALIALLTLPSLLLLAQPGWPLDAEKARSDPGGQSPVLHGAVNQADTKLQGAASGSRLRMARPAAGLSDDQSLLPQAPANTSGLPVLDINRQENTVQDIGQSAGSGLGLLGMYVLCSVDPLSPYYITNVFPLSQLNQCGLQSGDLLMQINGQSPFNYLHTGHPTNPGATITLTVEHQGATRTVSANLMDMRTFVPSMGDYAQWAEGHIAFLKEHHEQYRNCALF